MFCGQDGGGGRNALKNISIPIFRLLLWMFYMPDLSEPLRQDDTRFDIQVEVRLSG